MSKQRQKKKLKKQQLLRNIQLQRLELSNNTQLWKSFTEPYDKSWQKLLSLKPYLRPAIHAISLYSLRHPMKFYRLSRHIIRILKWK
ncbi:MULTISPECIES: YqjK-like family protein [Photorhabdus]|uniref:YqjK-like family protein n=1 Tax=Photorhabdus bodei TaxID=2029681 RepID=A0AAW6BMH7_9GAMM|nr:YqjK-like family protein [Photorhabdus bodei]MDB6368268.1 YqjK-like family protein [Photorhabdus bodei]MDB6372969.1 YqjK-like family protein [Photorhabdus bodei]